MTRLRIVGEQKAPGSSPAGLAWDGTLLWNVDYTAGILYGLEPEGGRVVDSLVCPGVLSGLAWDGEALWQGVLDEGWLRKINPRTHDFDHTIAVPGHDRLGDLAWDGLRLWVVSQQRGLVLAINPQEGEVVLKHEIPVAAAGLAYRDQALWAAYPDRMIYRDGAFEWVGDKKSFFVGRINISDGSESARYEVGFLPLGLTWVGKELWLAGQGKLYRAQIP